MYDQGMKKDSSNNADNKVQNIEGEIQTPSKK